MSKTKMPVHGNTAYPWRKWQDGKTHRAVAGQHFTVLVESFRKMLLQRAKLTGQTVTTRVVDDVVTFQFSVPEEPSAPVRSR